MISFHNCSYRYRLSFIVITVVSFISSVVDGDSSLENITVTSAACLVGLAQANPVYNEPDKVEQWFNDDSVLELALTGTYKGAKDIAEYFTFVSYSAYYDYSTFSEDVCPSLFVDVTANNECVAIAACQSRAQMNKKTIGKEVCTEDLIGIKLFYSVGENFNIRRMNVYIPGDKFTTLFEDVMTGDGVRDNVCNVLMSDRCKETARLNDIKTKEECESKYDALPATQKDGHIDQNSKGCRILHAAFAESNQEHCPHLSFIPQEDSKGRTKCQEGAGLLNSDLFLDTDLQFYEKAAADLNYSNVTFSRRCEYDPSRSTKDSGAQSLLLFGFVYSIIGAVALFSW